MQENPAKSRTVGNYVAPYSYSKHYICAYTLVIEYAISIHVAVDFPSLPGAPSHG